MVKSEPDQSIDTKSLTLGPSGPYSVSSSSVEPCLHVFSTLKIHVICRIHRDSPGKDLVQVHRPSKQEDMAVELRLYTARTSILEHLRMSKNIRWDKKELVHIGSYYHIGYRFRLYS